MKNLTYREIDHGLSPYFLIQVRGIGVGILLSSSRIALKRKAKSANHKIKTQN